MVLPITQFSPYTSIFSFLVGLPTIFAAYYQSWKARQEARLAREAELCYATVAMVTDYDCWHPDHDDVTVDAIVKVLLANADNARNLVRKVAPRLGADDKASACGCRRALQHAMITAPHARDPEMVSRLSAVAGRLLGSK